MTAPWMHEYYRRIIDIRRDGDATSGEAEAAYRRTVRLDLPARVPSLRLG